jgi:hypothetical protein
MAITTEDTSFTHDILGRYVCNTFGDAKSSGTFDAIIIGGGTFGLTLAQDLFERSRPAGAAIKPGNYRILVLEGGPFTLPEHVQDLPSMALASPGLVQADPATLLDTPAGLRPIGPGNALPATRLELINARLDKSAVFENWGMPWNSTIRFGGLAYCLGGRSLYFGGWSPRYLATEMETAPTDPVKAASAWPQTLVDDLKQRYFLEAARQTGASTSNDYIEGTMHSFFRQKLFGLYPTIPNAIPITELPDYVKEALEDQGQGIKDIVSGPIPPPYPGFVDSLRLDAPLAVQILSRPGFFQQVLERAARHRRCPSRIQRRVRQGRQQRQAADDRHGLSRQGIADPHIHARNRRDSPGSRRHLRAQQGYRPRLPRSRRCRSKQCAAAPDGDPRHGSD